MLLKLEYSLFLRFRFDHVSVLPLVYPGEGQAPLGEEGLLLGAENALQMLCTDSGELHVAETGDSPVLYHSIYRSNWEGGGYT